MTKTRYKFIRTGYKSNLGNHKWKVGKWYTHEGGLDMCNAGFHCSKGIYQASSYVRGEILTKVEVEGNCIVENDKEVWGKMRIIKSWKWTKKDSVLLGIYAAKLVLKNFEKEYPSDDRPRKAIEAAEKYVRNPTTKNGSAVGSTVWTAAWSTAGTAESAAGAWAAESAGAAAESAAESAAGAAWSAAKSAGAAAKSAGAAAESAAETAAGAAWSAVGSAESAAKSAGAAVYKKLDKWMLRHLKELRVLQEVRSSIKTP